MNGLFSLLLVLSLATGAFYFLLFRRFLKGWQNLPVFHSGLSQPRHRFSIIIPCRNEAKTIAHALEDIIAQDYPPSLFEIIVVNDYSTDLTQGIAEEFAAAHPDFTIRVFDLRNIGQQGKKAGITAAINISYYEWIVTSDADCRRGMNWLSTLNNFISRQRPVLVSMPVEMQGDNSSFFSRSQALEFIGLIAIGAATMSNGEPTMCNGANLCYLKELFYGVGGFSGIDDIASGDDELLMHKIFSARPDAVRFLKAKEVIAVTRTEPDVNAFVHQRKRWVSKSRRYDRKIITWVMIGCYLFNFCIAASLVYGIFNPLSIMLFVLLVCIKLTAEYPLLRSATEFFDRQKLMSVFIPGSLLHILYVLFIGIYGNFGTYNWKGRTQR